VSISSENDPSVVAIECAPLGISETRGDRRIQWQKGTSNIVSREGLSVVSAAGFHLDVLEYHLRRKRVLSAVEEDFTSRGEPEKHAALVVAVVQVAWTIS
jgi:hypothetical protein